MNRIKKIGFFVSLPLLTIFSAISSSAQADTNPNQTISGSVSASGNYSVNLGNSNVNGSWKDNWKGEAFGNYASNVSFELQGNTIILHATSFYGLVFDVSVTFDDDGNMVSYTSSTPEALVDFCFGDNPTCKVDNYSKITLQTAKILTCSFNCDQKNNYSYSINYQAKKDNQYSTINTQNAYKCEEIKGIVTPCSEWFGTLSHNCAYRGDGREKIFTLDTISPPTNLSACADQTSCLSTGTEYSLTPTTFGKGVQKVSADFVSSAQNSLNAGTDSTVHCSGGLCTPYSSGSHAVSLNIPETSYFGSCRGAVQSETVEGKTITTPEVNINTAEAKIPGGTSTLDFNVLNRAPLASLSLDKTKVDVGDEVTATCDIQDPDTCSDKIINVKWTCYNSKNEKVDCYFNQDGIWKEGKLSKDVPDSEQSYQYRSIVKWKAGKQGVYAIACEGTDNDETSSATGKTVTGITVGPPTCEADGVCNLNCPYDPDCCGDSDYNKSHSSQCVVSAGSCTVVRTKPSLDITLINPFDQVDFQANVFGGSNPTSYTWYCDKTDSNVSSTNSTMRTDSHTCDKYSVPGKTYEPKVSYSYKDEKGTVQTQECTNVQGIGVKVNGQLGADSCSCIVLARPKGSTDTDDYSSTVKISAGNQVDAKIKKNCTKKDPTVWTTDGTKVQTSDTKALIQYDQAGIGYIKANIGGTVCTGASVDVSEKVKMGN